MGSYPPGKRSAHAAEDSIWSGQLSVVDEGRFPNEVPVNRGNVMCEYVDAQLRMLDGDIVREESLPEILQGSNFETKSDPFEECVLQGKSGLYGANRGLWSPTGDSSRMLGVYRSVFSPVPLEMAPASDAYLIRSNGTLGYRLIIGSDISASGELGIRYRTSAPHEIIWQMTNSADSLRYDDGERVEFYGHAFSANGKYLAAHLTNGYIVRIDVETKEIMPVYQSPGKVTRMAMSSNGDYILSYRSGNLLLHDMTGCQVSFNQGSWPKRSMSAEGCTEQNLYQRLKELQPDIGSGITSSVGRLRFGLNSASISVDGGWRDATTNEPVWHSFAITPENYVSGAEGYLAMGDSFSSGEGDTEGGTWYEAGTDEQGDKDTFAGRNLCHLSRRSYPYLLAIELGYLANNTASPPADGLFHSVACSGAKIHNIVGNPEVGLFLGQGGKKSFADADNQYRNDYFGNLGLWQPGRVKQTDVFDSESYNSLVRSAPDPEAITLGIGGNDVDFSGILKACTYSGVCSHAHADSKASNDLGIAMAQLKQELTSTYRQVRVVSPESRIYVHGYPEFVLSAGGDCGVNVLLTPVERQFIGYGIGYMNQIVEAAAREAGVFYVDVEDIFSGSELCSINDNEDIAVNGVTAGNDFGPGLKIRSGILGKESYHPRPIAHELYRDAIASQSNNLTASMPEPVATDIPVPNIFFGLRAIDYVTAQNGDEDYPVLIPKSQAFITNITEEALEIFQAGLLPGSTVEVTLHSDPISLGTFQVDESGVLSVGVQVPPEAEVGAHELHIQGISNHGEQVDFYDRIAIGHGVDDFDGDGVLDIYDACPAIQNSGIDADADGVDDVCDIAVVIEEEDPGTLRACQKHEKLVEKLSAIDYPTKMQKVRRKVLRLRCKIQTIKQADTLTNRQKSRIQKLRQRIQAHKDLLHELRVN